MRLLYYFGLAIVVVIIDQWSKWLIVKYMQVGQSIEIVPNLLYLTSHRNKGAAWGMLQGQLWLFYILTVIVVIGIIYYMVKYGKDKTLQSIGFSFILGERLEIFWTVFSGKKSSILSIRIFSIMIFQYLISPIHRSPSGWCF